MRPRDRRRAELPGALANHGVIHIPQSLPLRLSNSTRRGRGRAQDCKRIELEIEVCEAGDFRALSIREESTRGSGKEVIQPQVPLRLPCYDFAPVTALAFGRLLP